MVAIAKAQAAPDAAEKTPNPPEPAKAGKKGKKLDALGRFNKRVLYIQALGKKLADELRGQVERLEDGSKTKKILVEAVVHLDTAIEDQRGAGKNFFQLAEVKWKPSSGARLFRAGDVVAIKARHVERFTKHGAYTLAELKGIKVVSVHGTSAKISTAKGEALGLIALSWLAIADK